MGGWAKWVMGIKEGTCWDEYSVLYISEKSLNTTPEKKNISHWPKKKEKKERKKYKSNVPPLNKATQDNPIANIMFHSEKLKAFPLKLGIRQGCPTRGKRMGGWAKRVKGSVKYRLPVME